MGSPPEQDDERVPARGRATSQPLRAPRRVELARAPAAPVPRQRVRDERAALAESLAGRCSIDDAIDSGDELVFLREGLSARGAAQAAPRPLGGQDELDLHGMNRHEAA